MDNVDTAMWSQADDTCVDHLLASIDADDLESALFAVEGASPLRRRQALRSVEAWAGQLRADLGDERPTPHRAAEALRLVLGSPNSTSNAGFTGDKLDYYAPCNSALSEVIEHRTGQPITLASVWMMVGRRAGLRVDGVALPGHFIVRVGGDAGVLVDPFYGGRIITETDCAAMVSRLSAGTLPWEPMYLAAVSVRMLVERVLRNLVNAYTNTTRCGVEGCSARCATDRRGLYSAVRLLCALRDDEPAPLLLHARLAEDVGAVGLAGRLYEAIAERFPGTCEAVVAGRRLAPVLRAAAALH